MKGMKDMRTESRELDMETAGTKRSLIFNTGVLGDNPESKREEGGPRVNEMVAYDEA